MTDESVRNEEVQEEIATAFDANAADRDSEEDSEREAEEDSEGEEEDLDNNSSDFSE